jgi:succinate-acetate transporter protein
MSFATIYIPGTGIIAAYTNPAELESAVGIYLITWFMVTFFFLYASPHFSFYLFSSLFFFSSLGTLRKNIALMALFGFLTITFLVLAVANFASSANLVKAGGALGIITAFIAYYTGTAELLGDNSLFALPLGKIQ